MRYRTVTLTNDFHGTEARVRARNYGGCYWLVSAAAMTRACSRLCGVPGCTCGSLRGRQIDPPGIVCLGDDGNGGRVYITEANAPR